ncbi:MAG: 4-hydroxy-tetrahydrodipicolinate synthase, partial [Janthinobacterium lividum]
MFHGSIPALVTPFKDGAVDDAAFSAFVDWQVASGSTALVPCGTTGESATLTIDEHNHVIALAVEAAGGRVPVIAGCGSNDTATALIHMRHAAKVGAAAALVVCPYYNKPSQAGLLAHFTALAEGCDLPIIIYNIPGRSVVDMSVETMARLAELPGIIGVKDATGNLGRVSAQRAACGVDFCQLSGNDDMALGFMAMGGAGCISVTANVAPDLCAAF